MYYKGLSHLLLRNVQKLFWTSNNLRTFQNVQVNVEECRKKGTSRTFIYVPERFEKEHLTVPFLCILYYEPVVFGLVRYEQKKVSWQVCNGIEYGNWNYYCKMGTNILKNLKVAVIRIKLSITQFVVNIMVNRKISTIFTKHHITKQAILTLKRA